ncbi:hypothetical protein BC936DRAFT_140075 [Jimgerdemannia flammicorona]|uniref:Uncharacterized protein n=1 Tax=Jimgerdemannia flammicorona TaxID=994334 RepID=A0A433DH56_9FUNG|nr:hypothetical protein BC936DRAFT_140075 [Jimgerdemannia flammicorona]
MPAPSTVSPANAISTSTALRPPLTCEQGEQLLLEDLVSYENCVTRNTVPPLGDNEFAALVSFTFSEGCSTYSGSTLRRKLNARDTLGLRTSFRNGSMGTTERYCLVW